MRRELNGEVDFREYEFQDLNAFSGRAEDFHAVNLFQLAGSYMWTNLDGKKERNAKSKRTDLRWLDECFVSIGCEEIDSLGLIRAAFG